MSLFYYLVKFAFVLDLLWTAPEILRLPGWSPGTQKGDVYSFAIILQEIIVRGLPFEFNDQDSSGILSPITSIISTKCTMISVMMRERGTYDQGIPQSLTAMGRSRGDRVSGPPSEKAQKYRDSYPGSGVVLNCIDS